MALIDRVKLKWHADLIRNPETHGWVMNLYLNGERYPQTVSDYFQTEFAPTQELAAQLTQHARDEKKHEALFTRALNEIGKPVVLLPAQDVFNEIVRSFTPGTFHIQNEDHDDVRRFKLANFMAHAHHLEKRVSHSLTYHLEACQLVQSPSEKYVAPILADENRHIVYTRETVYDLLRRREADAVMQAHRRAEARANLRFSANQVRNLLHQFKSHIPKRDRLLYRFCALAMEGAEHFV